MFDMFVGMFGFLPMDASFAIAAFAFVLAVRLGRPEQPSAVAADGAVDDDDDDDDDGDDDDDDDEVDDDD